MAGGSLGGDGLLSTSATDIAPNGGSYKFDTFEFRGDGYDRSWENIDTTLFQVEVIPEPATLGLVGLFGAGMLFFRRHFRI